MAYALLPSLATAVPGVVPRGDSAGGSSTPSERVSINTSLALAHTSRAPLPRAETRKGSCRDLVALSLEFERLLFEGDEQSASDAPGGSTTGTRDLVHSLLPGPFDGLEPTPDMRAAARLTEPADAAEEEVSGRGGGGGGSARVICLRPQFCFRE